MDLRAATQTSSSSTYTNVSTESVDPTDPGVVNLHGVHLHSPDNHPTHRSGDNTNASANAGNGTGRWDDPNTLAFAWADSPSVDERPDLYIGCGDPSDYWLASGPLYEKITAPDPCLADPVDPDDPNEPDESDESDELDEPVNPVDPDEPDDDGFPF